MHHLVRVGAMGHVGRFVSVEGVRHAREQRVIVRTARGLECGEVLSHDAKASGEADGRLLRAMTPQDEMLAERLERHRTEAGEACARLLAEQGSAAVLLDVEPLFDGRGLYFYLAGESDPIADRVTAQLAAAYEAEARVGRFADALEHGCGPGCGTAEAENGCGSAEGGCSGCAIAAACGTGG